MCGQGRELSCFRSLGHGCCLKPCSGELEKRAVTCQVGKETNYEFRGCGNIMGD